MRRWRGEDSREGEKRGTGKKSKGRRGRETEKGGGGEEEGRLKVSRC